jgi:hypothetical protein
MGEYTRSDIEWQPSAGGGREQRADVRSGLKTDMAARPLHFCFTANSGHASEQ